MAPPKDDGVSESQLREDVKALEELVRQLEQRLETDEQRAAQRLILQGLARLASLISRTAISLAEWYTRHEVIKAIVDLIKWLVNSMQ